MLMGFDGRDLLGDQGMLSAVEAETRRAKTAQRRGGLNDIIFVPVFGLPEIAQTFKRL